MREEHCGYAGTMLPISTSREPMRRLVRPLRVFCATLAGLWVLTFADYLIAGVWLHRPVRQWWPLYQWVGKFTDFSYFIPIYPKMHHGEFFVTPGFSYPSPMAFVLGFFYRFGEVDTPLKVFLGFTAFVFVAAAIWFMWILIRRGFGRGPAMRLMGLTALLSYPAMFLFERANIEVVCWLLLALGVTAYWRRHWYTAAILFGVVGSLKLFPAIFLALLISRRKYGAAAVGTITAVGITLVSLWALGPTFTQAREGIASGMSALRDVNITRFWPLENGYDHSLFSIGRLTFHILHPDATPLQSNAMLGRWLQVYFVLAAVGGLALYFGRIRRMPRVNQLLALTLCALLMPPLSYEYTFVHLYLSFAALLLFIAHKREAAERWPGLTAVMVCFAILFAGENYLFWDGIRWSGQFRAGVMLLMLGIALRYPFPDETEEVYPVVPA
jgi:hypothetical protein